MPRSTVELYASFWNIKCIDKWYEMNLISSANRFMCYSFPSSATKTKLLCVVLTQSLSIFLMFWVSIVTSLWSALISVLLISAAEMPIEPCIVLIWLLLISPKTPMLPRMLSIFELFIRPICPMLPCIVFNELPGGKGPSLIITSQVLDFSIGFIFLFCFILCIFLGL